MAQIAAQMYTLRDFCKTEEGFIDACRRVKRMGYDGVQLSGVIELDGKETKKILDGEGLKAVVTHISLDAMENHTEAVIERHLGVLPQGRGLEREAVARLHRPLQRHRRQVRGQRHQDRLPQPQP